MGGRVRDAIDRRLRGGRLLLAGKTPREVAEQIGVSRQTAYAWRALLKGSGSLEKLGELDRGGARARLGEAEMEWLDQAVCELPETHQLPGDRWSLKLVQRLLEQRFKLTFSYAQVSRLLRKLHLTTRDATAIGRSNKRARQRASRS